MKLKRIDHIGINVNDLAAAKAFFVDLGLEVVGEEWIAEGEWLDDILGLKGVKTQNIMLKLPEGGAMLEISKYHAPTDPAGIQPLPPNILGIRHLTFPVDDLDAVIAHAKAKGSQLVGVVYNYEDTYKLCYIRGPEGIILEFAQELK